MEHPIPRHWPHAGEHSRLCLRQLHLAVLQSVVQLHLMTRSSSSGAGGSNVITGTTFSSFVVHPNPSSSYCRQPTTAVPAGTLAYCGISLMQRSGAKSEDGYDTDTLVPLLLRLWRRQLLRPSWRTVQPYLWTTHWRWICSATILFRDHIVWMWCHTPISRVWTGCCSRCQHPTHFAWLWYPRCGSSSLSHVSKTAWKSRSHLGLRSSITQDDQIGIVGHEDMFFVAADCTAVCAINRSASSSACFVRHSASCR